MNRIAFAILLLAAAAPLRAGDVEPPAIGTPAREEPAAKDETPPPKTLKEAHQQLEKIFEKEELAMIDAMKTESEMIRYHFGLGLGMRNTWGLWAGGPLAKHLNSLGFHHPDDMSAVILETFWCKRHNKDFRLEERAASYAAYWKAAADPPDTIKDPKDGSEIDWTMSLGAGDEKTPRQIHAGQSKRTGRWLVYEYDKGIYEPDATLLKRITGSGTANEADRKTTDAHP
jgi:hypothetical protein